MCTSAGRASAMPSTSVVLPSTTKGPKGQIRPAPNNICVLHTYPHPPPSRRLFCLFFCSRGPEWHLPGHSMPPVYSTSRWEAKLQSLELSDLSCSHCNLVVHIPIMGFTSSLAFRPVAMLLSGSRVKAGPYKLVQKVADRRPLAAFCLFP
jgi:hypothetical protein